MRNSNLEKTIYPPPQQRCADCGIASSFTEKNSCSVLDRRLNSEDGFAVPVIALNTTFQASENDRSVWNDTKRPLTGSSIQLDRTVGGFRLFNFGSNLRIGAFVQH